MFIKAMLHAFRTWGHSSAVPCLLCPMCNLSPASSAFQNLQVVKQQYKSW